MNSDLVYSILDILTTMRDAVKQMVVCCKEDKLEDFHALSTDLRDGLSVVREIAERETGDDACSRLRKACVCAAESLKDIRHMALYKSPETVWKLECELLMILENMWLEFYYWKLVYEHPEKLEEFREQIKQTGYFYRLDQPAEEREYACDLSIFVIGYNHLDVTRICVENVLRNLPEDISYELILFNHGSDDGTREYFEGIKNAHVVNLAVNKAVPLVPNSAMRGKYSLYVSNDVFVGKNAIDNMYRTLAGHEDYGWIVPSTPNISNLQTVASNYSNYKEFLAFAEQNNVYDERRHEVRVRLCNPIHMLRTDDYNQLQVELYEQMYGIQNTSSFPDDKISLWMRRHGLKNVLLKDSYCHHVGSVTHRSDFDSMKKWNEFYDAGRMKFERDFGVDPWGLGSCYEPSLFDTWKLPKIDHAAILGINCGLGSNSLKVKETLKEMGAKPGILYNATQEKCYLQDLKGISDKAFVFDNMQEIVEKTGREQFDFIVVDNAPCGGRLQDLLEKLKLAGIGFGEMAFRNGEQGWCIVRGK